LPGLLQAVGQQLHLTWTYGQPPDAAGVERDLVFPSREELHELQALARLGHLSDLRRRAAWLAGRDERYRPFARRLDRLAAGGPPGAVLAWVTDALALETALVSLPPALRTALEGALHQLDPEAVRSAIEAIRTHDAGLAQALAVVADNFQYDRLLDLLQRAGVGPDRKRHG
jgi:hypothetical protein